MPTTKHTKLVLDSFIERLGDREVMPFDEYVDFALYDSKIGYYTIPKTRVGRSSQSDFIPSSSYGVLWSELIVDACKNILSSEDLTKYTFVEIAAEPEQSVLSEIDHPFGETKIIRLGDPQDIPSPASVYSNEWLDAQVFKRFCFNLENKSWQEMGVAWEKGLFRERPINTSLSSKQPIDFPKEYSIPYQIDWPSGSIEALELLCSKKWSGLFLTFDYGLPKEILFRERPEGTARSYYHHKMGSNLLSQIGEQDITCHLCWDELVRVLENSKFTQPQLVTQESFLMNHASEKIKEVLSISTGQPSPQTQFLKELLHPLRMGNKFKALWGIREEEQTIPTE